MLLDSNQEVRGLNPGLNPFGDFYVANYVPQVS